MRFRINGFHTSENRENVEYVKKNAPFISKEHGQWLAQGYYFWTEILMWAEDWAYEHKIITEFDIDLPREKVLDLVGSLSDQEKFREMFKHYCVLTKDPEMKYTTISKFLTYIRGRYLSFLENEPEKAEIIFPFWAIRAKDGKYAQRVKFKDGKKRKYVPR